MISLMEEIIVGIQRVAGRSLLQTKALRAFCFFKCASYCSQFVSIMYGVSMQIETPTPRRMVWSVTFLGFQAPAINEAMIEHYQSECKVGTAD